MKKTYIVPSIDITEVVLCAIIAASGDGVTSDGDVATPDNPGSGDGSDAAVKRHYNVWDDDWREDKNGH